MRFRPALLGEFETGVPRTACGNGRERRASREADGAPALGGNQDRKVITCSHGWTIILDKDMALPVQEEEGEQLASHDRTRMYAMMAEGSSAHNPKKPRHLVMQEGEVGVWAKSLDLVDSARSEIVCERRNRPRDPYRQAGCIRQGPNSRAQFSR